MGSLEAQSLGSRVGVATASGRAYYRISGLLKKIGMPFVDVVAQDGRGSDDSFPFSLLREYGVIITTREERMLLPINNVVCEEDLGHDAALAKQKLLALLYPVRTSDVFVVGVDPGERTGIAAFSNRREVESSVHLTLDAAVARVSTLIDNAPEIKKVVKIGAGNSRALYVARLVKEKYRDVVEIDLVDESGTSVLRRKSRIVAGTRDQRAARLIAFRTGTRYDP